MLFAQKTKDGQGSGESRAIDMHIQVQDARTNKMAERERERENALKLTRGLATLLLLTLKDLWIGSIEGTKEKNHLTFRKIPYQSARASCPRVSDAALANAALVLSSKNWKLYSRWGATSKNTSQKPWASISTLSLCGNRCRFSESATLFSQVHHPSETNMSKKFKH